MISGLQVTGKCGSVRVRLVPAPRGTGIVAAKGAKKFLQFAGLQDVYTNTTGSTKTLGNFVKAAFAAVQRTYGFLSPDLWASQKFNQQPVQAHSEWLAAGPKKH